MTPIHPHIEAIARAMCEADGLDPDQPTRERGGGPPEWLCFARYAAIAYRSTLSQIREPSEKMVDAGWEHLEREPSPHAVENCWYAMLDAHLSEIDAALKESKG